MPGGSNSNCTIEICPVENSIYGYNPSKPANLAFCIIFAASCLVHLVQGIRGKSWSFMISIVLGTAGEAIGYVGRVMMYNDWWNKNAFTIQIVCLTVAPAFMTAGIYLTLKHTVIVFGAGFSRIRPKWYTWIFIVSDIFSIIVQAAGAVIAARGTNVTTGNNIMIFGLGFQVFTLVIFGLMASEYAFRVYKFRDQLNVQTTEFRRTLFFKGTIIAITIAYTTILMRCIYRVAEMAGGWRSPLMQDEALFIALDSVMCSIAVIALNVFHPGFLFKQSKSAQKGAWAIRSEIDEATELAPSPRHDIPAPRYDDRDRNINFTQ